MNPGEDGEPDWSPDGTRIAYSSMVGGRYEIKVMNPDDTPPFRLVNLQIHNINPAWRPAPVSTSAKTPGTSGFSFLESYPNPTNGRTIIGFTIDQEGPVKLDILDINGKVVKTIINGYLSAGKHSLNLDLGNLSAGTYVNRLSVKNNLITRKLILLQ